MKGSYVLLIELSEEQTITVGRQQAQLFLPGYYAYVGSAMGGFCSRLNRHLKSQKKLHWHIDYLLEEASISNIIICESEHRLECVIAQTLSQRFPAIPGFGASDCHCHSHLFFASRDIKEEIMGILQWLGIKTRLATR